MENKNKKVTGIISSICIGIMMLMFFSIILRIFSRQILVEKLNMNNAFTQLVFFDANKLQTEETSDGKSMINWEELYPFLDEEIVEPQEDKTVTLKNESAYLIKVNSIKTKIEDYSTKFLAGHDAAANMAASLDKVLQWETPVSPSDFNRIIKMENGYLTYVQPRIDSEEIDLMVESIQNFNQYLADKNIPFLVVNDGSKVNPDNKQLSNFEIQFEHTNENADELMKKLDERGIDTLDIRYKLLESQHDWYKYYYKTDHHFTPEAGLLVAGKIAEKLNEISKSNYDLSLFDPSNYEFTTYENIMFGGQGRAVTMAKASLEDYTSILPKFTTDLSVNMLEENQTFSGGYEEAIFDKERLEAVTRYSGTDYLSQNDAYGVIRLRNTPVTRITNFMSSENDDLKVLFIEDSFSWYSTSFLSLGAKQTDIIYPIAFNGSIKAYVEETKPDLVVFAFGAKEIDPIDYTNHSTYFDLR